MKRLGQYHQFSQKYRPIEPRRRQALLILIGITILVLLLRYRREPVEWFETHEHLLKVSAFDRAAWLQQ